MNKLVFLLEEASMADLLEVMLPRFFPALIFTCIPYRGKDDLRKGVPRKLRGWPPGTHFMVIQDQDNSKCHDVKAELAQLCRQIKRDYVRIRIVCRELEAWYFGELGALEQAYPGSSVADISGKKQYRISDEIVHPARKLSVLIPEFQKRDGARRMGELLSRENTSRSFQVFLEGVEKLYASMQTTAIA